jgi:IrrE N-terminal-like domain
MTLIQRLPSAFRQRCESIATEQRSLLRLRAIDALPAATLAAHLNAVLFSPQQLPSLAPEQVWLLLASNSWSAAVVCQDPLWIVYHPPHAPARRESDLMHELAHALLKHPLVSFDLITGLPQRRQRDEDEATYLGGCLQIPRRGLLWAVERKMTVAEICAHLGASERIVRFRSNVTGVSINDV